VFSLSHRSELGFLDDVRKTCATYYDQHDPESAIEILGHFVGGITCQHYAHRAPLASRAIMTLPQPTAFTALVRGLTENAPAAEGGSLSRRSKGDVTDAVLPAI
jgi:hypothetical protein